MKSVLISIKPKWCEKIARGKKTIEVRKTAPKEMPFKAYIYETKESKRCYLNDRFNSFFKGKSCYTDMGKVIGEFICDYVADFTPSEYGIRFKRFTALYETCLTVAEMREYANGKPLYGWHISELKIYDKPKELSGFYKPCKDKYQYCEGCEYGSIIISPDEEEYALYHGGQYDRYETVCHNVVTRPPQSWCYIEETAL